MACVNVNSGFTSPQVGTELRCDAEFRMTPLVNLKYKNVCMRMYVYVYVYSLVNQIGY